MTHAPEIELTSEGYRRWLRAQRPPFTWFLALPEDQQEALAAVGDEQTQEFLLGMAATILRPEAAAAALSGQQVMTQAGPTDQEAELVAATAAAAARRLLDASQPPAPPREVLTMAGVRERRRDAAERRAAGFRLFGRPGAAKGAE